MTKNISRLYDSNAEAQQAIGALHAAGIPADNVSLIANSGEGSTPMPDATTTTTAGAGLGAAIGGSAGLLTGLGVMAIPGVGPIVAAGWMAATLTGLVAGAATGAAAGGIVSALADNGVNEADAHVYAEAIRRGGSLVVVRTDDAHHAIAEEALDRHSPVAVATRRSAYESEGWEGFDEKSGPYVPNESTRPRRTGIM
jgi:uncharacterized membrane protein